MKHKMTHHLVSALFAFVLTISAIGSLVTGHELPVDSLWKIYLWGALLSVLSSVLFRFRYGGRVMGCIAVFVLLVLWKEEAFWQQMQEQTQCLGYFLSSHYHDVYDWPILGTPAAQDVSLPLIIWVALVSVSVNWHICRSKHIVVAIIPVVIPLILCLLTTDRIPDTVYLYLLILGLAILLITDWTRKKQPDQGIKLLLWSALPIAISLGLLFIFNPREKYANDAIELQKEIAAWFQELRDTSEAVVSGTTVNVSVSEKLDLNTVGPKSETSHYVMRVNSPIGGALYLRGRDYDEYTGTGWNASANRSEEFSFGHSSLGELTIFTYGVHNVLYVPYYATERINLVGGAVENEGNFPRYSYYLSQNDLTSVSTPESRYTQLPEDTLRWARELVADITDGITSNGEKIIQIQNYVQSSASYDLSTVHMDSDYSDFAQWFLEESETGYCTHFATAATVLLRAAGIPARYVEGYMANCRAGLHVVVTNQDAHAWVEYFDSDSCMWRILEVTPDDLGDEVLPPTVDIPEKETSPKETQPETDSGEPETEPSDTEGVPTKPQIGEENSETPTDPTGNVSGQSTKNDSFQAPGWVKSVFVCLLFAVCIPLQGYIRIYRKRKLWNQGRPNERTMTRWRQTRSFAKLLKQPYPEALDNLAQKAKFSQHTIRQEELQQFEDYHHMLIKQVAEKPWYLRIVFKWILAIGENTKF